MNSISLASPANRTLVYDAHYHIFVDQSQLLHLARSNLRIHTDTVMLCTGLDSLLRNSRRTNSRLSTNSTVLIYTTSPRSLEPLHIPEPRLKQRTDKAGEATVSVSTPPH